MADDYNAKNYTEQGGGVTHIGGKLIFDEGCKVEGGLMPNVQFDTGYDLNGIKICLANLFVGLKDSGLMVADDFTTEAVTKEVNDSAEGDENRYYNIQSIEEASIADEVITVRLLRKISELKDFDSGDGELHKWMGIGMSVGYGITGLKYNGEFFTQAKKDEAEAMGLENKFFVLWFKADEVIRGKGNTFTIWAFGHKETEFSIVIVEPEE